MRDSFTPFFSFFLFSFFFFFFSEADVRWIFILYEIQALFAPVPIVWSRSSADAPTASFSAALSFVLVSVLRRSFEFFSSLEDWKDERGGTDPQNAFGSRPEYLRSVENAPQGWPKAQPEASVFCDAVLWDAAWDAKAPALVSVGASATEPKANKSPVLPVPGSSVQGISSAHCPIRKSGA